MTPLTRPQEHAVERLANLYGRVHVRTGFELGRIVAIAYYNRRYIITPEGMMVDAGHSNSVNWEGQ